MKKDSMNKVRLGIFITAAIVLFILGVFFIGERQHLFGSTFTVKFKCADVSGLQAGNNVRFSGIDIGTVSSVNIISDTSVEVQLLIDKKVKKFIRKDSQASVGSEGLMGDKVVNISAGTPAQPLVENNDYIPNSGGNGMEQLMSQMTSVAKNATLITGDLAAITGNIREGRGAIGKLFMDTSFAGNLDQTIVNIKKGTSGLDQTMKAAQHNFLLRPYFKKKEKEAQQKKEDQQKTKP